MGFESNLINLLAPANKYGAHIINVGGYEFMGELPFNPVALQQDVFVEDDMEDDEG